jgi:Dolichyl-phosphate-mannose-protein mannosyltransferase
MAAVLRLWNLSQLPPGYWYDEAHKSLVALQIARGEQFPIYVTDYQGIEAGYFWLLAAWFRLFGPSFYATRYLAALIGTATVPLTYWAIATAYEAHAQRRLVALVAAAWLGFLLWHVLWSRLGLENITISFFAIALFGLMAAAWQREQRWLFAAAGAVLGISLYTSPGARVLAVQALITFAIFGRGPWRRRMVFGIYFLASSSLLFAPLAIFFIRQPQWFFDRLAFASAATRAGGWQAYAANALNTLLSIIYRGDVIPRHNLSLRPVFDPLSAACMFVGLASLWRGRNQPGQPRLLRAHAALLASLGLNLLPAVLSDGAPEFGRMLGAAPFVVVLPALGIAFAAHWLTSWPARALLVAVIVGAAGWNLYDYFHEYPRQPGLFDAFELGQWTLLQGALAGSRANVGYLVLDEPALIHPATKLTGLLASGDLRQVNGTTCLAYPAITTGPVELATLSAWQAPLAARLPGAHIETILHSPEVYPYGALIFLPAGYAAPAGTEKAVAVVGGRVELLPVALPSAPIAAGSVVPVTLRWRVLRPLTGQYNVFVHVTNTATPLVAGADGEPCQGWYPTDQWHAGEVVEHTLQLTLPANISPGAYSVAVGMYDWRSGARLPVAQDNQREPDRAFVGSIEVK